MFVLPSEFQLLGYILIFGSILFLAYIAARFVGQKTSASMQSKHMQLVEQISLGIDKRLLLVRVGSEHFLFLSGKKEFRQIAKVKISKDGEQEIDEVANKAAPGFDFRQVFSDYISGYNEKRHNHVKSKTNNTDARNEKSEIIQGNIQKLEQLSKKSKDKEV